MVKLAREPTSSGRSADLSSDVSDDGTVTCATQDEQVVLDLPLPEVAAAHAQVNFDDTRCFGNAASRGVPEAAWRKLEAPLAGGDSSVGA